MKPFHSFITRHDADIAFTDFGGDGQPVVLLHGLAGSSRELVPTAKALSEDYRVILIDQRGHGLSSRRAVDLSRQAFVDDIVAVINQISPSQKCVLVGQSMGAHTAFMVAATRPDLVAGLVMLEGHVGGNDDPDAATDLCHFFASWPLPFADEAAARDFLGVSALADAWIADLQTSADGLRPRFEPEVMAEIIREVHVPRWREWAAITAPTLAVFAKNGMFSPAAKDELIARRPGTDRIDLPGGSHDAHLDAFDDWLFALKRWLKRQQ